MSILFIGSYTEEIAPGFGGIGKGINTLELNEETGVLSRLHEIETLNPGYIVISDDKKFLYTFTEVIQEKKPKAKAYKILDNFSLEFINEVIINGSLPCHINYYKKSIFITCYGTGNLLSFAIGEHGELLKETANLRHYGNSINIKRQEAPHAHQVVINKKLNQFFVPDLGIDKIKVYDFKNDLQPYSKLDICVDKGFGPRHIVFNSDATVGYIISELTGKVGIVKNSDDGFKTLHNVASLPLDFKETPSASAIRIHPNNKYLYVANRNIDAISIFKIKNETLQLIAYTFTNGKTLREFNISKSGKWLIVSLQDSHETIVYKILSNGKLEEAFKTPAIKSGVCITFL